MRASGRVLWRAAWALALGLSGLLFAAFAPSAVARDAVVRSFDGTPISLHFFPAAGLRPGQRAPTVMEGPGWGGTAAANPDGATAAALGVVGLGPLHRSGYNVLTWNPRGFDGSGGLAEIDSAGHEGRDVSAVISWLARQPEARLDRPGDPRVGMVGGSYGGGIQLTTAAIDHRIDAIVPDIAWHSLLTSLYKADTVKLAWSQLLALAAQAAGQRTDPTIAKADAEGQASNILSPDVVHFFATRGPGQLVSRIRAPTLLIQGTVDTLFTLREAVGNYEILHAHHVPTKMLWFCGGHGACLTNPGDTGRIERDTLRWLARYLKGEKSVKTGPGFEWLDQRGRSYSAPSFPPPSGRSLSATGSGRLSLIASGGSGPYRGPFPANGGLGAEVASATPSRAANAVDVSFTARSPGLILGAPQLQLTYRGRGAGVPARVLAQIVDDQTGKVLGNQITPIPVVLDGTRRTVALPLEIVIASLRRGSRLTLQLVAQSSLYDTHPAGGSVTFSRISLTLPSVRVG
ncbi:MAG: hypothetical protein JO168_03900 [Solirubrobacterales bacterium]|nr:hypothetical protein [Solirubrobacterales bacterium]